jgi:hypothetical protein
LTATWDHLHRVQQTRHLEIQAHRHFVVTAGSAAFVAHARLV